MHDDLEQGGGVEARQQQPLLRDSTNKRNVIWTTLIWIWRICIFAVTGSSSVAVTRFILEHIFGTTMARWLYYVLFFFLELVVYTVMIVSIGTILGQHRFFFNVAVKMWGWMLPARYCTSYR
ncbi:hypothetical protein O0I10_008830 [Lichtheimia ornata]|uniref:DUF6787 domain-containing protein n=1 Tax=Lichtheimia ornata TaxID=688661 RepID=A0AAD7UYZ9_9FUNG|nr:uncharacterized protein O0I10_008830 [Lichtheimia ornata]KAJ8655544.1 hypothetical protein O0I10_008830 [Lichtheimia ornata]